jgi:hypothetical protein
MKYFIIVLSLVLPAAVNAGNDPACAGRDQNVCDAMGTMLLARGKPCAKMIQVTPMTPLNGGDRYRIICQPTSKSKKNTTYVLEFGPGNQSYDVR